MTNLEKLLFVVSFRNNKMYITVDLENANQVIDLKRYGIDVRNGTQEDKDYINGLEQEMDIEEDDVGRDWEEDEGCIVLTIKDWD